MEDKILGGRVLSIRTSNRDCSDHKVLSACSSKPRQVRASDTRLFGLPTSMWSATSCVNSLISIMGEA